MHAALPISVLILYAHPLLGVGLARLLSKEPGLNVVALDSREVDSVTSELNEHPDVVILERAHAARAADLLGLAPNAVVIDVALDRGPGASDMTNDVAEPDGLVRAIRSVRADARDTGLSRPRNGEARSPITSPLAVEAAGTALTPAR